MADAETIDTTGMPADAAARYHVMVAETRRVTREVDAMRLARDAARAEAAEARREIAALRAALGLAPHE